MRQIDLSGCLVGRFYFKKSHNGNLTGEFSNNRINFVSSESADVQDNEANTDFVGTYNTTWQQEGQPFFCKLIISYRQNTSQRIYSLEWRGNDGNLMFVGEGFVFENTLIGDYRDFQII